MCAQAAGGTEDYTGGLAKGQQYLILSKLDIYIHLGIDSTFVFIILLEPACDISIHPVLVSFVRPRKSNLRERALSNFSFTTMRDIQMRGESLGTKWIMLHERDPKLYWKWFVYLLSHINKRSSQLEHEKSLY